MTTITRGVAAIVCLLLLWTPLVSQAQLGAPGGGGGGGAAPDLTCTNRGADGKLSCGDIGLEETMDFCDDVDGDYVCDDKDECPDTPKGVPVFMNGCHEMELKEDQPWVLRGVNFEFDEAVLMPESVGILDAAVNVLDRNPELLVAIDGHTDSKGSDRYNERLSRERAKTVHDYFVDNGVSADRLAYRGFGESRPIAPNQFDDGTDNPEGRFENRRVELNVLDMETFNTVKAEIAEREAERAAAEARRAAQAAAAAAAKEKEEKEEETSDKDETAEEKDEGSEGETEAFDESDYLDFTSDLESDSDSDKEDSSDSDAAAADETQSGDKSSADESSSSDSEETDEGTSEFNEAEYLDFLEESSDETDTSSEGSE